MWKTLFNKSIAELRFVLKGSNAHDGVWRFTQLRLYELSLLNQNTFFSVVELTEGVMETESAVHVIYGDLDDTQDEILTKGLSTEEFESILKSKVHYGLTLKRNLPKDNTSRFLPVEHVEASKTVNYMDDNF